MLRSNIRSLLHVANVLCSRCFTSLFICLSLITNSKCMERKLNVSLLHRLVCVSVLDQWCRDRHWNISIDASTPAVQPEKCSQSTFERIFDSVCIKATRTHTQRPSESPVSIFFYFISPVCQFLFVFTFLFVPNTDGQ